LLLLRHLDFIDLTTEAGAAVIVDASPYILPGIVAGVSIIGIVFQTANSRSKEIADQGVDASEMGIAERVI
jgi:hypothetical protein